MRTTQTKTERKTTATGGHLFFAPVQAKLAVNQPNDVYEREADAVAEKVMRMTDHSTKDSSFFQSASIPVQRKCAHCEEEEKKVQRKEQNHSDITASDQLTGYIGGLNNKGAAMSGQTKQFFESRMGYDFSDVRVHTDSVAAKSARSINAVAYTSGNNIVFNQNQYQPGTDTGDRLLAHELTHVVQQGANNKTKNIQRTIGDGHDLTSPRFSNETTLEDIYDGNGTLLRGSSGEPVKRVQHALQDMGIFLHGFGIDGLYERETERAVTSYQRRKRVTGDATGVVGVETIAQLNADFPAVTDAAATLSQNPATVSCLTEILCPWNRGLIDDFRKGTFLVIFCDRLFWADELFNGTSWVPNPMEGAGETSGSTIRIAIQNSCEEVARTLYHEYQHARSPRRLRSQPWANEEENAYRIETEWAIRRGLTPDPSLVTTDASGEQVVDTSGVEAQVDTYPGMVSGSAEEVIAKVGATRVRARRSDGTVYIRAAANGDSVPGRRVVNNPRGIRAREWVCA